MERPTNYALVVTGFLDGLIEEYGHYLFMGFAFLCLLLLVWMFTHRRKYPVNAIAVVIIPLGPPPIREREPEPVAFRNESDHHLD